MKRVWFVSMALMGLMLTVPAASTQPPPTRGKGDRKVGPPPGGPQRFELGRLLPPPLIEELHLSEEQRLEIFKLEKEVKERLSKILTGEQKNKVENFRPRGPGRPDGPPRGGPERPDRLEKDQTQSNTAGIQWFATWESGLGEARRTGRPILLVSAAPHCGGVSGTW